MKIKKAFTMAEAILVMTILGIIATIMITTLKPAEFKKDSLRVLAKKVLSEIDTATTQVLVNDSKLGSMANLIKESDGTTFQFQSSPVEVIALYKKYLTTIRTTVESTSFCRTGLTGEFTATLPDTQAVYLKDGACIGVYGIAAAGTPETKKTLFPGEVDADGNPVSEISVEVNQGLILFDTNGQAEPNTIGEDRFILPIVNEGIGYDS